MFLNHNIQVVDILNSSFCVVKAPALNASHFLCCCPSFIAYDDVILMFSFDLKAANKAVIY